MLTGHRTSLQAAAGGHASDPGGWTPGLSRGFAPCVRVSNANVRLGTCLACVRGSYLCPHGCAACASVLLARTSLLSLRGGCHCG